MKIAHGFRVNAEMREAMRRCYHTDEATAVRALLDDPVFSPQQSAAVSTHARTLLEKSKGHHHLIEIERLLAEYRLDRHEGIALMCCAEALLRVPDADNMIALLHDKLEAGDWRTHIGHGDSFFANAFAWGLFLGSHVLSTAVLEDEQAPVHVMKRLWSRLGEQVIYQIARRLAGMIGKQFVFAPTMDDALKVSRSLQKHGYRFSYDMLGESAWIMEDADRYFEHYASAIRTLADNMSSSGAYTQAGPSVSVKLSALHPRYEASQIERVRAEVVPRVLALARAAHDANIGLTIDAERADHLEPMLDVIEQVATDPSLNDWEGFGLAIQAYQKRCLPLLDWLAELARKRRGKLCVRLVKGAYWDTEIKHAQEGGYDDYPVFTRKAATDLNYLACVRKLLANRDLFFPQFATHNAHTVAAVLELAGNPNKPIEDFEFQRLHGMGESLYQTLEGNVPCRVYAAVGSQQDLISYLIRRLLESGANTSFVHQTVDRQHSDQIVVDPADRFDQNVLRNPKIPLPADILSDGRRNSRGLNLSDPQQVFDLESALECIAVSDETAPCLIGGKHCGNGQYPLTNPAARGECLGYATWAGRREIETAFTQACHAQGEWNSAGVQVRAECLNRVADLFDEQRARFIALAVLEAGKTLPDAIAEVREAIDFCRYYAKEAETCFAGYPLDAVAGERNEYSLHGRGVFVSISPWNFPMAIFTGQVAAALVSGNGVIAKPAEQTPLMAFAVTQLLHEAGVPKEVLQLVQGDGEVGAALVRDPRVAGVVFTGGNDTAAEIAKTLAACNPVNVPFIAETGGLNAMIVDSTALPEQVVHDVMRSAFHSAGQRCSSLRLLFVQREIATRIRSMLAGAVAELQVGDPRCLATDVGPLIDQQATERVQAHAEYLLTYGSLLAQAEAPDVDGFFVAPQIFEINRADIVTQEVFGPILHLIEYESAHLDQIIAAINAGGYGLTLGIHSRIQRTVDYLTAHLRVGNIYVNRNIIGAAVGMQPFGGCGLSGSGPKAGGKYYLPRFAREQTLTTDLTAIGGNPDLLVLDD